MPQTHRIEFPSKTVPAFLGIRGYCCIAVFLTHAFKTSQFQVGLLHYPALAFLGTGAIAVTLFFVLSGYLITKSLRETRHYDGHIKAFYTRRILRLLPPYYCVLIAVACVDALQGVRLDYHFWADFLCIQNMLPGFAAQTGSPISQTAHLWSVAVEWQFYVLWPLAVWCFRSRRSLLRFTLAGIALSWVFRLACPLLHIGPLEAYFLTPARIDAILLGAALALVREQPAFERARRIAPSVALVTAMIGVLLPCLFGEDAFETNLGSNFSYFWADLSASAILLVVLNEQSLLARACNWKWICRLGVISYSVYLFHFAFRDWDLLQFVPRLTPHMHFSHAIVLISACSFGAACALATLSYFLIERPARMLGERLHFDRQTLMQVPRAGNDERVLAERGLLNLAAYDLATLHHKADLRQH